jgi:hypothetical protein
MNVSIRPSPTSTPPRFAGIVGTITGTPTKRGAAPMSEAPSPEMMIGLAGLVAERERKGKRWCRKLGVGARWRLLGRILPVNVVEMPSGAEALAPSLNAQRQAQTWLLNVCKTCRGCPLGRE